MFIEWKTGRGVEGISVEDSVHWVARVAWDEREPRTTAIYRCTSAVGDAIYQTRSNYAGPCRRSQFPKFLERIHHDLSRRNSSRLVEYTNLTSLTPLVLNPGEILSNWPQNAPNY